MPVFISYRHKDRDAALGVAAVMHQYGIKTYLDVLDPQSQTTDQITDVITTREGANKSYGTRAFTGNPLILND